MSYNISSIYMSETASKVKSQIQQGLEIREFWFQKKTVQLKTVLREVYTYAINEIFFKKPCIFKAFVQNPCFVRLHLCTKGNFYWLFSSLFGNWDLFQLGPLDNWDLQAIGNWDVWAIGTLGNWDLWTIGDSWIILDPKDAQNKNKVWGFFRNLQGDWKHNVDNKFQLNSSASPRKYN